MIDARKHWIAGAIALGAGVFAVASLDRESSPVEIVAAAGRRPSSDAGMPPSAISRGEDRGNDLEEATAETRRAIDRTASPSAGVNDESPANARGTRTPRKESEFYAEFLATAERDPAAFESAARAALSEAGPDCRKVAALRALCDRRSPTADAALVAAVLELPDVSSGHAESVPGYALRRLSQRAREGDAARRALEALVVGPLRPNARLRAAAVVALCAVADEAQLAHVAERLHGEQDEVVLATVRTALSPVSDARVAERDR